MLIAALFALAVQDVAAGHVVWTEPAAPAAVAVPNAIAPTLPDWALADPFGWERAQCSPLVRGDVTLEACQAQVRAELAANLGDALPAGLRPVGMSDECRQTAAGDRYRLQCGAPERAPRPTAVLAERDCSTRPRVQPQGGVAWSETCRPANGRRDEGLSVRLGGRD